MSGSSITGAGIVFTDPSRSSTFCEAANCEPQTAPLDFPGPSGFRWPQVAGATGRGPQRRTAA
jgi:hypothetical protein